MLTAEEFGAFFESLHGHPPYPWQERLARRAAEGDWPTVIDLPTGSGKTACIDAAVFAMACQARREPAARTAPLRVFFCVNRRVIVDEAHRRARRIAEKLLEAEGDQGAPDVLQRAAQALRRLAGTARGDGSPPLDVLELRGGIYCDNRWARSPVQPTVVCTTVDQIGSRLLFRGYGVSPRAAPLQAALIAWDSLVLLDEAHISRPFLQTLDSVRTYLDPERWADDAPTAPPMRVVPMTATPPGGPPGTDEVLRIDEADRNVPTLAGRLRASKRAALNGPVRNLDTKLVEAALELIGTKPIALAVMVNRVDRARSIHAELERRFRSEKRLKESHPDASIELVIGAMRPVDRERQAARLESLIGPGRPPKTTRTCIVVSTQCLEVGADYDFDALVTECASLDALRQRFGRLNRAGRPIEARAIVVTGKDQVRTDDKLREDKPLDPIYGNAIARTWNWLLARRDDEGFVDFGVEAMADVDFTADEIRDLLAPSSRATAPVLLPAHLDSWVQTSPVPVPDPEVSLFLHGLQRGSLDVQVCWRADLDEPERTWAETVALLPPSAAECLSVPLPRLRRWLAGEDPSRESVADLIGAGGEGTGEDGDRRPVRRAVLWRGREESKLLEELDELKPGDTLVLPASQGGWNELGHVPGFQGDEGDEVAEREGGFGGIDEAERAFRISRSRPVLRLRRSLRGRWPEGPSWDELFAAAADPEQDLAPWEWEELLRAARDACGNGSEEAAVVDELLEAGLVARKYPDGEGVVLAGRRRLRDVWWLPAADEGDDAVSCVRRRTPVPLGEHLEHVRDAMREFAALLPLDRWRDALEAAALLHDLGKADERFQAMLLGVDRTYAWLRVGLTPGRGLVAKSESVPLTPAERAVAAERAALPRGFRHEMLSAQLAEKAGAPPLPHDPWLRELALHLIASHHGYGRPFAPVVADTQPPEVAFRLALDGSELEFEADAEWRQGHPPHRIDSGVAERFWRLVRRHGWWGLAWFEALVRLADQRASSREERDPAAQALAAREEASP